MSMRLTLVSSASTPSVRIPAFPRDEEDLDERGRRDAARLRQTFATLADIWRSPARRALETATAIGIEAKIEPRLRDMDAGRWAGRSLEDIETAEPEALAEWLTQPAANPHGGESLVAVGIRVAGWLTDVANARGRIVAVTHPAIIRAAIVTAVEASPTSARHIDIAPLSVVELSYFGGRWVLKSLSQ